MSLVVKLHHLYCLSFDHSIKIEKETNFTIDYKFYQNSFIGRLRDVLLLCNHMSLFTVIVLMC